MLPNLGLTQDLMELFEMNWVEYVRRDTEGSDQDTRRRAATDLVRSLTAKFPGEASPDGLVCLRQATDLSGPSHQQRLGCSRSCRWCRPAADVL